MPWWAWLLTGFLIWPIAFLVVALFLNDRRD
jgi:hypothetical protein